MKKKKRILLLVLVIILALILILKPDVLTNLFTVETIPLPKPGTMGGGIV